MSPRSGHCRISRRKLPSSRAISSPHHRPKGRTACFYPGEIEYLREQERRKNGIEVEDATWDKLRALAAEYRIADELGLA